MRHRSRAGVLGRSASHRTAMYRNMVTSLLDRERIETTDAKAKTVRRLAERMITLGKRGDLHARRRALRVIRNRDVAAKVFDDLAERFRDRPGGYTRVIKVRNRVGDAAAMSIVELVEPAPVPGKPAKKASGKKSATKKAAADDKKKTARKKKAPARKKSADADADSAPKKKTAKKAASKKKAAAKPASKKKTAKKAATKKTSKKK